MPDDPDDPNQPDRPDQPDQPDDQRFRRVLFERIRGSEISSGSTSNAIDMRVYDYPADAPRLRLVPAPAPDVSSRPAPTWPLRTDPGSFILCAECLSPLDGEQIGFITGPNTGLYQTVAGRCQNPGCPNGPAGGTPDDEDDASGERLIDPRDEDEHE